MKGRTHAWYLHLARGALAGGLVLAALPGASPVAASGPETLPDCSDVGSAAEPDGVVVAPWRTVLDGEGAVTGHRMTLRRLGRDITLEADRRSFAVAISPGRLLVGQRSPAGTLLSMLDTSRACRAWTRRLDDLLYPTADSAAGSVLPLTVHEPGSRRYRGTLLLDVENGASNAMIDGECASSCEPNDGEVPAAAYAPAGYARPVPNFPAGAWPKDKTLPFRWRSGAVPPDWAKGPLKSAADDARRTASARSPLFVRRSNATNSVSYSATIPPFCATGIACASRVMPSYWAVWIRPHGTEFAWGTLRWCQKKSVSSCYDIRRVALHELGHVTGLNHPSSAGFTLAVRETVMQAITPAKPNPGSTRHAFGRCDVATLQELYDVPDNKTAISTCNDVATTLALQADKTAVSAGKSVTLTAELRIDDRSGYRQLSGNPLNGRSVKLKYRRAGSSDPWTIAWMRSLYSSGRYQLTISPQATWEFKATFPSPSDEGLRFSRSEITKVKVKS